MGRSSPQQNRPVHTTPFMNHSTTPSYVSPSHDLARSLVVSHGLKTASRDTGKAVQSTDTLSRDANYDTANPAYIRKYLRTYGLTPLAPRATKPKRPYLSTLRKNNVHLFYRLITDHLRELTPLIYTPVVGEACQRWSEIYQQHEGMYLSWEDRGNLAAVIANWPQPAVEITCITDGSRILGLGDLGINGMGIPIGKLALYTACAGIRPEATLPLTLDLGTSNKTLREDPLYMGSRRDKISPEEEREFLDELMLALTERWPGIVIQFEDFKNPFPALERYKNNYTCFNDDIQGTGAVILGGVINAVKRSGLACKDQRAVFFGAGSAGVGVAKQIVDFFVREGMTEEDARNCFYLVDTKGLVTADRGDKLADHKVYFARQDNNGQQFKTLEEVVDHVQPTILMGLSTMGGVFTPEILRKMADWNTTPIIFPFKATDGRCLFASGSPFPTVSFTNSQGQTNTYYPGQGNNMYVFPGIGMGCILSKAVRVTDNMIYASGEALSKALTAEEIERGLLYPDITRIREVSVVVARNVMRAAQEDGVDRETALRAMSDKDLDNYIKSRMYDPHTEVRSLEREVGHLLSSLGNMTPFSSGTPTEEINGNPYKL
ncbi:NADP-dependent malic enzyme [Penicillium maclennaniae]|uniref:NADP-dependent malic enzyme n=1 Tax=Penicillium maclennaniae TaxID=1343394 RepID=UPI002540737E|nr:NADP-dependent malic enzyme [Penicillium maclennaniae]KAJ5674966.1 NADP-dependent malic enzyme [Penicillium maclennaniae]